MDLFKVNLFVRLKPSVFDPKGEAIERTLQTMGIHSIQKVRIGKLIEFFIEEKTEELAKKVVELAAEKLFHNPVIENYTFEIERWEKK